MANMQCLLSPTLADNLRLHCMTDECIKTEAKNSNKSLNPDEGGEKKMWSNPVRSQGPTPQKTCA